MPWLGEPAQDAELWSGPLELLPQGTVRDAPDGEPTDFDPRDLPEVAIRQPETWPLTEQYPLAAMPPQMRARANETDFYIVRLSFSMRPTKDEVEITWARFAVQLKGAHAKAIHPDAIEEEVARTRRFTLAPSLKFAEVEAQAGELEFGFEYKALEPKVYGATEPYPSWDFQPTEGHKLYGDRYMHLLVGADLGTSTASAQLRLVADVSIKRFLRRASLQRNLAPLDVVLW
jgi:hypothetical protein